MSTPIENNTEELQELLRLANNLPEATDAPVFQEKTVSPTTETETYTPDPEYDGFSSFTVNAMPTAEQATPSVSVSDSGLITASATQEAGYVSAGTKFSTKQLTTQGAKAITPSTSAQTAVASGVFTTGAVTVDPIPSSYVQPSGTKDITENGTHDVRNYESVNVDVATGGGGLPESVSAISAGTYTPASDITSATYITHDMGVSPDFALFYADEHYNTTSFEGYLAYQLIHIHPLETSSTTSDGYRFGLYGYNGSLSNFSGKISKVTDHVTDSQFRVMATSSYKLKSGTTYKWLAIKKN